MLDMVLKKNKIKNVCDVLLVGYEDQENLGLRSIAAYLTKHGIKVRIEPYQPSLKNHILTTAKRKNPKIVGFSLIFQRMLDDFTDLITYLRQNGIDAHFTIGGHFPTMEYRGLLEYIPALDSVVRQEGEQTLLELFEHVDQPNSWLEIKGLAFRKHGKIIMTPARPLIRNLDSLPFPIRNAKAAIHRDIGLCSMLASRGCYYNCSFCSIREFYQGSPGPKRRTRSPANVVREMQQLFNRFGVRIFIFQDDDWCMKGNVQHQWIFDFVRELKKKKLADQILWRISSRVDELNAELLKIMKEAGLMSVYMGIESGNEQGLKTFNKHYGVDDVYRAINLLQKLNIPFEYGFMIFDPDSTMTSVEKNITFLENICRDGKVVVNFCKMVPYAGTPIAGRLKKEGRLTGTIVSPDYNYKDPRLGLLQLFFSQVFNFRNFDDNGLIEQLRSAKFDTIILNKFFSDKYDTKIYSEALRNLTHLSNESALKTMSFALHFMQERNEEDILDNWHFLDYLAQEEMEREMHITAALEQVTPSLN